MRSPRRSGDRMVRGADHAAFVDEPERGLNRSAVAQATRLAESPDSTPRWIGTDALRQLATPAAKRRLARRS